MTCMLHACSLTRTEHCHTATVKSQHTDKPPKLPSIQTFNHVGPAPEIRIRNMQGPAQHNAQAAACDNLKRFQGQKWLISISYCPSECRALQASSSEGGK